VFVKISMPKRLKVIGEKAFAGIDGITEWVMPDGLEEIKAGAFAYNSMESVYIPESVKVIGDCAIADAYGIGLTIIGKEGSTAEKYAKKEGLTFVIGDGSN